MVQLLAYGLTGEESPTERSGGASLPFKFLSLKQTRKESQPNTECIRDSGKLPYLPERFTLSLRLIISRAGGANDFQTYFHGGSLTLTFRGQRHGGKVTKRGKSVSTATRLIDHGFGL